MERFGTRASRRLVAIIGGLSLSRGAVTAALADDENGGTNTNTGVTTTSTSSC